MKADTTQTVKDTKSLILNAISGRVQLPRVSQKYVFGLLVTSIAVLLLPLLYVSVMVLAIGCEIALIRHADVVFAGIPDFVRWTFVGLSVVFVSGLLMGMLKPLFAKASALQRPRILGRESEPLLAAYVDRLCDLLGTARPSVIHIHCDLNAGAEFRRSWLGIWGQREIALHIGLPLVAGLTLRQFTGVLTHELGHFTQRTAMWLENLVRRTNHWLLRAAFERDSVDEWLDRHCAQRTPLAAFCLMARAMVWLARRILLGLSYAGTAISCLMSREMEFNADKCQVRVVGARSLATTLRRLRELTLAHQISFRDIAEFYSEGRLPDDLITLATANAELITHKMKSKLHRMMSEEQTGMFDTHPSDQDRIRAAVADGSLGIFQNGTLRDDLPASVLFTRFQELSKSVTEQYYRDALNHRLSVRMLHPVEKLLERQNEEIDAAKALRRYFQTGIPQLRPLPIAPQSADPPDNPKEVAKELRSSRDQMLKELPNYHWLIPRYRAAEESLFETIAAQTLLQAGLTIHPPEFRLPVSDMDVVTRKQTRAREAIAHLAGRMLPFETDAGNRLSFALQLLHVPSVIQRIPHGDDVWYEVKELLPEAQYVSRLIGELPSMRFVFHRMIVLWEKSHRPTDRVLELILGHMKTLRSRLTSIQNEMGNHLYPFDHARADTTLKEYALPLVPGEQDLGGIVQATEQMQSRLIVIQSRLFARLARAAEKVEAAIGMPPLPEPTIDDTSNSR